MKKFFLILFILLDLAAMAGAAFMIYSQVTHRRNSFSALPSMGAMRSKTPAGAIPVASSSAPVSAAPVRAGSISVPPTTPYRNIGFTYKNVKAKQVLIRADFTGWKGVPMKRDASGLWSYQAQLIPGEYAYCFTVDDKIIKDPASKHTKRIAQTLVSAITVEKAPVKVSP